MALLFGLGSNAVTGGGLSNEPQGAAVACYELKSHLSWIESGSFSPDSRFLAVGTSGGEESSNIAIWDLKTKEWTQEKSVFRKTFPSYIKNTRGVAPRFLNYTFDGQRLILFQGGALRILDPVSLVEQSSIELDLPLLYPNGHAWTTVWDMKVSPVENKAALLIGGYPTDAYGLLRVYDLVTKRKTFEWKFEDNVNSGSISFSPDGRKIAVATHWTFSRTRGKGDPNVVILDLDSGSVKLWLDTGEDGTANLLFAGDNELVAVPMWHVRHINRGAITFWDVNTGKMTRKISDAPAGIHHQVEISRDGKTLFGYTGKQKNISHFTEIVNQRFRLWELPSGKVLADSLDILPLAGTSDPPAFRLSPDGKTVFGFWLAPGRYVAQVCEVGLPGAHAELPNPNKRK